MQKRTIFLTFFTAVFIYLTSCSDSKNIGSAVFNPDQPIEVTGFYPDSGGIATPMIVEGRNFGSDTTNLKVYFEDVDGIKHPAGLVSSNGNKIYLYVPSGLTYKKEMNLLVARTMPDGKEYEGQARKQFIYKTQTSVTTVIGQASPDADQPTVGGDIATSTLSAPNYICLDDEDNIFITERHVWHGGDNYPSVTCKNDKGENSNGNVVMASVKSNSVLVLQYGTAAILNAPAFSDIDNTMYAPEDGGMGFYALSKSVSYAPRRLTVLLDDATKDIADNNYKHCFVVNKLDHYIYTVMVRGQLVRIKPNTRTCELLLKKVGTSTRPDACDSYCAFSPVKGQENMLYIAMAEGNQIWRVDVGNLEGKDKNTYPGEGYAGKAIVEGQVAGKGWEDGLLRNAKFNNPHQICFTEDGKLYIADCGNNCIRVIDTRLSIDKATVSTPIGLPGMKGYKDGGPDIAMFNHPFGVAVSADGQIVYVADTGNKVIRKLSIE